MLGWLDELNEMNYPYKDIDAISIILASLNADYDNLITALEAWDDEKLTIETVKAKLVKEYERRFKKYDDELTMKEKSEVDVKQELFEKQNYVSDAMMSREGFLCHACGRPGHFRSSCPHKTDKWTDKNLRQKIDVKKRSYGNNKYGDSAKAARAAQWHKNTFIGNEKSFGNEQWFLDSGASSHV